MFDFLSPKYDKPREFVTEAIVEERTLPLAEETEDFLKYNSKFHKWPTMSVEEWNALVDFVKSESVADQPIDESIWAFGREQDNGIDGVPTNPKSSWQCYKNYLIKKKDFNKDVVEEMEKAAFRILRRLRGNLNDGPGKGLVVGNVQSGKTANMAAVMAMAADWGFNFFIVLSGTIENLRLQTKDRLWEDLNRQNCNLNWHIVDQPIPNAIDRTTALASQDLSGTNRYFTVALKNSSRLKNLIKWLQEDRNAQGNLKVLVIDDEADQAGINTADISLEESTAINQLIKNLVFGYTYNSGLKINGTLNEIKKSEGRYSALNYIGYTATPYANVLNEAGEGTLYPSDFLTILKGSKEYFGPQQIFGNSQAGYDGLDIIRELPAVDVVAMREIHKGERWVLPESLKDAVKWFICGVAVRRFWDDKTPVTLLIHTDHRTNPHNIVAGLIIEMLRKSDRLSFVEDCLSLWEKESTRFTKEDLLRDYPDYSGNTESMKDLPSSEQLRPLIESLLRGPLTHILINEDDKLEYHKGIHLCIDNSGNNGVQDGQIARLIYPDKNNKPDFSTAFIVVGGQTLSRGLTLEGLVASYFLRTTKTCDTLMQMGRWFGYRKGYELLPRIWMSADTRAKFEFLSDMDQDLREEIHRMAALGISPDEAGPRIMNSPDKSFLKIVAENKQKAAVETDFNFSGIHKETTVLNRDEKTLINNRNAVVDLLNLIGSPEENKEVNRHARNARIWRNVGNENVMNFLKNFRFSSRQRFFNDLGPFIEWMSKMNEEGQYAGWNVVLAGIESEKNGKWTTGEVSVNMITRTPMKGRIEEDAIDIQHLLDPNDMIVDIDVENNAEVKKLVDVVSQNHKVELARIARDKGGLERTPRLIIYPISKDSKANSENRTDMDAPMDLIGIDILVPGVKERRAESMRLTIKLDPVIKPSAENEAENEY